MELLPPRPPGYAPFGVNFSPYGVLGQLRPSRSGAYAGSSASVRPGFTVSQKEAPTPR